jgi:hypothetical protein
MNFYWWKKLHLTNCRKYDIIGKKGFFSKKVLFLKTNICRIIIIFKNNDYLYANKCLFLFFYFIIEQKFNKIFMYKYSKINLHK